LAPSLRQLRGDAVRSGLAAASRSLAGVGRLRPALTELSPASAVPVARTSLNEPTGSSRRIVVTRADLEQIRAAAHAHGATVNDVVLTAVTRALHSFLAARGESLDSVVASVMVSGRPSTTSTELGNRVGVMPVRLPAAGDRAEQLGRIAAITGAHRTAQRGSSAGLLQPAFTALAALGLVRRFINRQRVVQIFVTNLRGPGARQRLCGAAITDVLPIGIIAGNVTLSFAIMSYAGTLAVVIVADPLRHPDLGALVGLVGAELGSLAAGARPAEAE